MYFAKYKAKHHTSEYVQVVHSSQVCKINKSKHILFRMPHLYVLGMYDDTIVIEHMTG